MKFAIKETADGKKHVVVVRGMVVHPIFRSEGEQDYWYINVLRQKVYIGQTYTKKLDRLFAQLNNPDHPEAK